MFGHDIGNAFKLFFGVEHAGGVAGAGEHDELGLGGDSSLELLRSDLEVVLDAGFDINAFAFGHANDFFVGDPEGGGDNHLVAGVDQALYKLVDALLGTGGNDDLLGGEIEIIVAFKLVAYGLAKVGIAGDGGIVGEVVVDGLFGSLFDSFGSIEIGFADGKTDDIFALSLEFTCFCGHSESFALGHV